MHPPDAAFDPVKSECAVDALPKVAVLDWQPATIPFPAPMMTAPFVQSVSKPACHSFAGGNQGHSRRLIECFQPSDDGQQFEPFALQSRLVVRRLDPPTTVDRL